LRLLLGLALVPRRALVAPPVALANGVIAVPDLELSDTPLRLIPECLGKLVSPPFVLAPSRGKAFDAGADLVACPLSLGLVLDEEPAGFVVELPESDVAVVNVGLAVELALPLAS